MATDAEIAERRLRELVRLSREELRTTEFIKGSVAESRYKGDLRETQARLQNNIAVGEALVNEVDTSGDVRTARLP